MNCPHCGHILSENMKFCGSCGKLLPEEFFHSQHSFADKQAAGQNTSSSITSAESALPDFENKHGIVDYLHTFFRVLAIFCFIYLSVLIAPYVAEKFPSAKSQISYTTSQIKYALNGMDFETLGNLLTEESKENIVQVLSQDNHLGENFAVLAAEGKSYADLFNEGIPETSWYDYRPFAEHELEGSNWVDLNFNMEEAKISSFARKAVVPYQFYGSLGKLILVKEKGEWLISLSKNDINTLLEPFDKALYEAHGMLNSIDIDDDY